jgi:hypothetical protein
MHLLSQRNALKHLAASTISFGKVTVRIAIAYIATASDKQYVIQMTEKSSGCGLAG